MYPSVFNWSRTNHRKRSWGVGWWEGTRWLGTRFAGDIIDRNIGSEPNFTSYNTVNVGTENIERTMGTINTYDWSWYPNIIARRSGNDTVVINWVPKKFRHLMARINILLKIGRNWSDCWYKTEHFDCSPGIVINNYFKRNNRLHGANCFNFKWPIEKDLMRFIKSKANIESLTVVKRH